MSYIPLGQFGNPLFSPDNISASNIRGGTITAQEIILGGGTKGVIRSQNLTTTTGWAIYGDGSAFFGGAVTFAGDFYSATWDGTIPIDLSGTWSTGYDTGATTGFAFDSSLGRAQISDFLWIGQGSTGDMLVFDAASSSTTTAIDFLRGGDKAADIYAAGDDVDNTTFHIRSLRSGSGSLTFAAESTGAGTASLTSGGTFKADEFWGSWAGSVSQPTYSWSGDQNTGFYNSASNEISASLGGVQHVIFTTSYFKNTTVTGGWALKQGAIGTAATPTYTFRGNAAIGMYRYAADEIGMSTAGVARFRLDSGGSLNLGTLGTTGMALIRNAAGTSSQPTYGFQVDTNTGMFRFGENQIGFGCGAQTSGYFGSGGSNSHLVLKDGLTNVGNHEVLRLDRGSGTILRAVGYYSSWAYMKKHIAPLEDKNRYWRREWFKDLEPVGYERRQVKGGTDTPADGKLDRFDKKQIEIGFTIDNLIENTNLLTTKGERVGDSPDEYALLAVTVDYVQYLEERIAALEALAQA